jgi:hypothetical protein
MTGRRLAALAIIAAVVIALVSMTRYMQRERILMQVRKLRAERVTDAQDALYALRQAGQAAVPLIEAAAAAEQSPRNRFRMHAAIGEIYRIQVMQRLAEPPAEASRFAFMQLREIMLTESGPSAYRTLVRAADADIIAAIAEHIDDIDLAATIDAGREMGLNPGPRQWPQGAVVMLAAGAARARGSVPHAVFAGLMRRAVSADAERAMAWPPPSETIDGQPAPAHESVALIARRSALIRAAALTQVDMLSAEEAAPMLAEAMADGRADAESRMIAAWFIASMGAERLGLAGLLEESLARAKELEPAVVENLVLAVPGCGGWDAGKRLRIITKCLDFRQPEDVRRAAARALADPALPAADNRSTSLSVLAEAVLGETSPEVRRQAARILDRLPAADAVDILKRRLPLENDAKAHEALICALTRFPLSDVEELWNGVLADPDPARRETAVRAASRRSFAGVEQIAMRALADPDPLVRAEVCRRAAILPADRRAAILAERLRDPEAAVRLAALSGHADVDAAAALKACADAMKGDGATAERKAIALSVLAAHGSPGALEGLREHLMKLPQVPAGVWWNLRKAGPAAAHLLMDQVYASPAAAAAPADAAYRIGLEGLAPAPAYSCDRYDVVVLRFWYRQARYKIAAPWADE